MMPIHYEVERRYGSLTMSGYHVVVDVVYGLPCYGAFKHGAVIAMRLMMMMLLKEIDHVRCHPMPPT